MKYNKYIWQSILVLILVAILFSCSTLKDGRYYTVEEVRGSNTITLKEVKGDWKVPSTDTLNSGDRILVKRVFKESKANIY